MQPDNVTAGVGLILLAAGESRRMGRPKQLLPYGPISLLRHAAQVAVASGCSPIVVVLGANSALLQRELEGLAVSIVLNPDWEEGMGASIRRGIAAIEGSATDAAVLLLCDQPFVTPHLIQALMAARADASAKAAVSGYPNAATGPPCVFSRALFPELLALRGAEGAKRVLAQLSPNEIAVVPFPDGLRDIDTPADWQALLEFTASNPDGR